jgi:hypothetical protein
MPSCANHRSPRTTLRSFLFSAKRGMRALGRGATACAALLFLPALSMMPPGTAVGETLNLKARTLPIGPSPCAIVAADLNDDGLTDIVTADRGVLGDPRDERPANDELSVLMAQPDGEYAKVHPSLKTGFGPYAIAIANIDALKWPEIIVANFHDIRHRDLSLFLNIKPEGLFNPVEFTVPDQSLLYVRHNDGDDAPIYTKPGLTSLVAADLNGDGLRDVLATAWSSDVLVFFPGQVETHFAAPRFFPAPGGPRQIALADLDGDKHLDAAVAMQTTGELALFQGDGAGGFAEVARFETRGRLPSCVKLSDINRDGKLDAVVSHSFSDDSIVIFYGDGEFSFSISQELLLGPDRVALDAEIRDIAVGDVSGDGRPEIAAACYASREVVLFVNESPDNARGQVFAKETYKFAEGAPRALCIADLDTKGNSDIAVALWGSNSVGFLMGKIPAAAPPARGK